MEHLLHPPAQQTPEARPTTPSSLPAPIHALMAPGPLPHAGFAGGHAPVTAAPAAQVPPSLALQHRFPSAHYVNQHAGRKPGRQDGILQLLRAAKALEEPGNQHRSVQAAETLDIPGPAGNAQDDMMELDERHAADQEGVSREAGSTNDEHMEEVGCTPARSTGNGGASEQLPPVSRRRTTVAYGLPGFFERQAPGAHTCLQHACNNAWQDNVFALREEDIQFGADIGALCDADRLGDKAMLRVELSLGQLQAAWPAMQYRFERIVVYLGQITTREEVQGHYIAFLKQGSGWFELDSLKESPIKVSLFTRLRAIMTEQCTLIAAVPATSEYVRSLMQTLQTGAFPYVTRMLGRLFARQQPILALKHFLDQANPPPALSADSLASYLKRRNVDTRIEELHLADGAGRSDAVTGKAIIDRIEGIPGLTHGLLWVRTAPFVVAFRAHEGRWQALGHEMSEEGPLIEPLEAVLDRTQADFSELCESAGSEERRNEVEYDRRHVTVIVMNGALPDGWAEKDDDGLADDPENDNKVIAVAKLKKREYDRVALPRTKNQAAIGEARPRIGTGDRTGAGRPPNLPRTDVSAQGGSDGAASWVRATERVFPDPKRPGKTMKYGAASMRQYRLLSRVPDPRNPGRQVTMETLASRARRAELRRTRSVPVERLPKPG